MIYCRSVLLSTSLILALLMTAKAQQYTFTTIDVPGARNTAVQGINSAGDVVGIYWDSSSGSSHGFLLSNGTFASIDAPGATSTRTMGINDSGLIVGYTVGSFENCFTYNGQTFKSFRDGSNTATTCWGINNAGFIVGGAGSNSATRGFEVRASKFKDVSPPGVFTYIYGTGINRSGTVVGFTTGVSTDGFMYDRGAFTKIDVPGATETQPYAINDSDVIAGSYVSGGLVSGFILSGSAYTSIAYPGASYTLVFGINSSGEIVGDYSSDFVTFHGFLATPAPSSKPE